MTINNIGGLTLMAKKELYLRKEIIEDLNENLSNRDFCWFIRMIQMME